ncbi:MAG: D-2-hydroxyacid dehydrogenase [Chthoniobacterales bacterium]
MEKLRIFVDFVTPPDILELLSAGTTGHELVFPAKRVPSVLDRGAPDPQIATAEIVFGQPDPEAIAEARALRWIQISSSGITRYDTPEFRAQLSARKIALTNSASVYDEACATHLLSFILAQARHLPRALTSRDPGGTASWQALRDSFIPLRGQTMIILGYGAIAEQLAAMLQPFAMAISGYRRKARGHEAVPILARSELEHALQQADHVVDILPDNTETRSFFDAARFQELKRGAVFYNIGRGPTVDQSALLDALHRGRLAAAWLDVTDPEPLPEDHPLRAQPNCFITPHVAGGHARETETLVRHFLENFQRFTRGQPLRDQVR